jgi:hypothetical protein
MRITSRDIKARMNYARTTRYSKLSTRDTKFFSKVRPTTKVVYVTKIKFSSSLSNLHEGEGNTNFLGLPKTLVVPE